MCVNRADGINSGLHLDTAMNRRSFLSAGTALAGSVAAQRFGVVDVLASASEFRESTETASVKLDTRFHRFGINYTPSRNWWYCWNDWEADSIRRDLDAIAALGADHLRLMLIWPYFQPSATWVSPLHLERFDQLISLMGERRLDALVTAFTGQLSGLYFMPPFHRGDKGFYTDPEQGRAQDLYIRELARIMKPHSNLIGFDFGNELNTCWSAPTADGDAWMEKMFGLMHSVLPDQLHVNGVDHHPWFEVDTFSQKALASQRFPVMHCYPFWTEAVKYGGAMDPPSVQLLAAMAALIRSYAGTQLKPVWAGEFNTCIKELTETEQAAWLEKSVIAAIGEGVSWFSYWDSHDVDRKFELNPLEYTLGLLTNDGRVKEQGCVFKQLADSYRGKPVNFPKAALPAPPIHPTIDTTWGWLMDWMGWKPKNA
jgi:endo-1,4-beta-mannosidase